MTLTGLHNVVECALDIDGLWMCQDLSDLFWHGNAVYSHNSFPKCTIFQVKADVEWFHKDRRFTKTCFLCSREDALVSLSFDTNIHQVFYVYELHTTNMLLTLAIIYKTTKHTLTLSRRATHNCVVEESDEILTCL